MSSIEIALLPPFVAVAELASFSAAAKRLRVDRSSISRSIARLEALVGAPLIHRTTRRVALSEAGKALYARLRDPLAGLENAVRDLAGFLQGPRGRLVVTAPSDFGAVFLSDVVARFTRLHPEVEVDVRLTSTLLDFVADGIDAAIRISAKRLRDSALKISRVGQIELGVFASPAYLERRGMPRTPAQSTEHEWVVFPSTKTTLFTRTGGTEELTARGRIACDDMFFVHHAVLNGIGLGVLPLFLADADVTRGRMTRIFPEWVATSGSLWFVTPAATVVSGAVAAFRELLVESLAQKQMVSSSAPATNV